MRPTCACSVCVRAYARSLRGGHPEETHKNESVERMRVETVRRDLHELGGSSDLKAADTYSTAHITAVSDGAQAELCVLLESSAPQASAPQLPRLLSKPCSR